MGRLPVFLYDDMPWIPYPGTNISVETFGFAAALMHDKNTIPQMVYNIKNMTEVEYQRRLSHMLTAVRPYYTYKGIITQITLFLQDPFGSQGGHLRCTYHPRTERCCG